MPVGFFHKYSYVFAIDTILLYILYTDFFLWLSKGTLLSPEVYLSQSFLAVVVAISIIVHLIRKHSRLKKIKLHYKVAILRDIVEPKESMIPAIARLSEMLSKSFYGTPAKSAKDTFLDKVLEQNMEKKKALAYLDEFADEYLASNGRSSIFVSQREHKINGKEWERLRKEFKVPSKE